MNNLRSAIIKIRRSLDEDINQETRSHLAE